MLVVAAPICRRRRRKPNTEIAFALGRPLDCAVQERRTALLVGAGFSIDMGMPLVKGLTQDLFGPLTIDKLNEINSRSTTGPGDHFPQDVLDEFAPILARSTNDPSFHYEKVLGWLQERSFTGGAGKKDFYHLYQWLVEQVSYRLGDRHIDNGRHMKASTHRYGGLVKLAKRNNPLWIFSLNHDLCVEMISGQFGIPVSCGYAKDIVRLPRRNQQGELLGVLAFETLARDSLLNRTLQFSTTGINLVKLHGSLDVFAIDDGERYLRLRPRIASVDGWIEALRQVNTELLWMEDGKVFPTHPTNEIGFTDHNGKFAILSRTLLAGEFKFDKRVHAYAPPELLHVFDDKISEIDTLTTIGYSFGDKHINDIICRWMEANASRQLVVVDPYGKMPEFWSGPADRVVLARISAVEYLDSLYDGGMGLERVLSAALRRRGVAWPRWERGASRPR